MKNLEDELNKVDKLKNDLFSEIVIQEETPGHYERVTKFWKGGCGDEGRNFGTYEENELVEGSPRLAEPDTKKRQSARVELEKIFNSSDWYSVRYSSALALGKLEVESKIPEWLDDLVGKYVFGDDDTKEKAREDLSYLYSHSMRKDNRFKIGLALGKSNEEILCDEILRCDGSYVSQEELKSVFEVGVNKRSDYGLKLPRKAIIIAGKALGYNPIKIRAKIFIKSILRIFR